MNTLNDKLLISRHFPKHPVRRRLILHGKGENLGFLAIFITVTDIIIATDNKYNVLL